MRRNLHSAPKARASKRWKEAPANEFPTRSARSKARCTHTPRATPPSGIRTCKGVRLSSVKEDEKSILRLDLELSETANSSVKGLCESFGR